MGVDPIKLRVSSTKNSNSSRLLIGTEKTREESRKSSTNVNNQKSKSLIGKEEKQKETRKSSCNYALTPQMGSSWCYCFGDTLSE